MTYLDGAAVRALVGAVPPQVFDALCDGWPELFDGLTVDKIQYLHWYDCSDDYTYDHVAQDYGYADMADMECDECYTMLLFDEGVLVIE